MHIIPNFSFIILTGLLTTGSDGIAPTSPGCATSELDLVFVMDSSADVSHDDLERSKGFIRRMILPFDINPVATRVSTITYGNTAQILNDLDDISVALTDFDEPFGAWEVIHILNNSVPMGGKRRTGQALRLACDEVLKFNNPETRRNVPAVVVIISAGYSEDDIPSDLSCKEDKSADVTIVGVSTDRRGAVIFGSEHIDRSFEINDGVMDSTEKKIFATVCNETIWNLSLAEQDLVFLLDRSNVIPAEDLKFLKRWIWEISHRFALGRNFTRVGILEFGGGVTSEMTDLTANSDDLREFIDAIRYYPSADGVGNLTEILRHVALDTFRDEGDDIRLNLHRNLIIITTSPLRITREAEIAARDLMLGGVNIFVVTVGMHGSSSLMQAISSKPYTSHIISTENYQELITSRKRMVRSLRDEVFKKYSGSLLELHFIVGGLASRADQIRAADLMKRISDLYLIGQHYTRVYITTGLEELGYAGEVKSGVFKVISSNDYQEPVDIIASVKAILNRETPSKKVIVIITPEVIRDATVWGAMSGANKRNGYIYSFGFTSGGLEWKYDSSGETELQELGNDYRPAADLLVDKISSDTTQDCRVAELDLQFLMDGSSSIQEDDFKLAKDWIESLISKFNVGQYTTRVGIDQYSGEPGTEFHMVDFNGKAPVLQAVTDIDQKTGLTKTGFAINYTLANSIIPSAGARSEVRQIFLVLTDGKSRDSVSYAAQRAHERPQLTTYAVGVADADVDELREIASEPKEQHVFQAENFNEISGLKDVIGASICKTATENITEADFNEVDLIVLFEDSTALMSKQLYPYLIQFIMRLAEKAAENYSSRVAVVKFSAKPSVIQQFTRNLTLVYQELINNKLESDQSQVNLGLALSFVKEMFGETPGRKHVKKILVTIVTNPITDKVIAEVTGLTEQGVNIFGISVGRCSSLTYLKQIASNPDYFFDIDRTHHLVQVEPSLRRYIREIPSAPPYVCDLKMDIAFVIDESAASTTEDFTEILSFIADISKRLVFGDNGSRLFITQLESDRSSYKVKSFTEEITTGDISRLVHMNDTLIDAANALGIIGAMAFQDAPRRNIPKFVVTITGASTAAAMDSEVVAESDAKLFTIAVGNTDVARTDVKSDILTLSSFDELAMVNLDIAKAICDATKCPTWFRGTEEMKGYDMISSLDLPSASGVKLIKLDGMPPRYRVTGKSRVRGQVSHIFPNGFPSQPIKLTASIKMGKRASSAHSWNIYELTDQRGRTEFSVTIDGKMKNIKLFRKGRPGATVTFSGGLVNSFFTKTWHLLELVLTDSTAMLVIDCQNVGSRPFKAFQSLPDNGQVRIGKLSNSRKSTAFELERLDISCGFGTDLNNSLENCTAVKDLEFTKPNKSPNPTTTPGSSESGVAPETLVEIPKQECNCTAGPPGAPGQKGERGVPGATGVDGKVGPVGPRGFKGSPGASVNIQSGIGQVGPPGPPGPRGPPGLPGLISSGNNLANVRNQKAFTMEATDARMTLIAQDECRAMINSAVPRIVMSILERELSSERFRGKKGDKGSQGETGRTGDKGHAGESGPRGKIGLPGMRGITGHEGPRGPKGNTGERGETGYGIPGINGVKGPRGYPGQSIRGDPGRKGERGDRGVAGPAGHRGLRGPAGINGRCEHHTCYNAALRFVSESMRGRENGVD